MNVKLVETFSELADLYADEKTDMPGEYHPDWHQVRDSYFAELLVRECAKFLELNSGYDYCNNAYFPLPEDMLKHFGVNP